MERILGRQRRKRKYREGMYKERPQGGQQER